MTYSQLSIFSVLGFLFCLLLIVFLGLALYLKTPAATLIPTLPSPTDIPPTPTPTNTPTPSPTPTPTITPTPSPTSTSTATPTATRTPKPTMTPTKGVIKPPNTTENIHVAQIFNSGVADPQDEIGNVDLVWGSVFPTQPEGVYNLYYYPFDRDRDGGTGGTHHDITWFLANHPDWIEYTCDKKTPAYEYNHSNVPLDITNPAVINYMMQTYILPAIQAGYQGIAFDNVDFGNNGFRCGILKNGVWVKQSNYIGNVLDWAFRMYKSLHSLDVSVAMNFPFDFNHPTESYQIFRYLDIAVDEAGFTNWGQSKAGYLSGGHWLTEMQALQSLDVDGKGFVSINEMPDPFTQISQEEKQWALANYLLAKGEYSYIAIVGIQEYGYLFTTPEYSAAIGHPLNSMYKSKGIYMRDFSNGKAIVNPSSKQSFTISFPHGVYQDLYGNNVVTITLEPNSGIVLLENTGSTSDLIFGPNNNFLNLLPFKIFPLS